MKVLVDVKENGGYGVWVEGLNGEWAPISTHFPDFSAAIDFVQKVEQGSDSESKGPTPMVSLPALRAAFGAQPGSFRI